MSDDLNQKVNGKAIAALVLGILAIVVPYIGLILGIIAIILANKSFKEIESLKDGGKGMAIAGLTCGIIGTSIYAIVIFIALIVGLAAL